MHQLFHKKIFTLILISFLLMIVKCQKNPIEIELKKFKFSSISQNMDINQQNHRQQILQDQQSNVSDHNDSDHTASDHTDSDHNQAAESEQFQQSIQTTTTTQQDIPEDFEGMQPLKLQACNEECISCGGICCIPSQCKSNQQCIEECK